jgi:hypothetical protein
MHRFRPCIENIIHHDLDYKNLELDKRVEIHYMYLENVVGTATSRLYLTLLVKVHIAS